MSNIGGNVVIAVKIFFGNVDLRFNNNHVKFDEDYVIISLAHMMAYPYGTYSFEKLDDE